jgi:hypothetical protein
MYWLVLPLPSFINAKLRLLLLLLLLTVTTSSNTNERTVKPKLL